MMLLRVRARWVAPLLWLLACSACSSARLAADRPLTDPPLPIVTPQGEIDGLKAERLLDRRLEHQDDAHLSELIEAFRHSARTPLVAGNRVDLLIDGPQTLAAIQAAIEGAQHHVHVETYIFADDEVGRNFRDLLIRRRAAGVEVRVLYDAIGSLQTGPALFDSMRAAGIEVLAFRPLDPTRTPLFWKINNRDHRKIVVVDGRIAFTGGINFSSTYASSSATRPGPEQGRTEAWRDTHVRLEGPVASQFQSLFFLTWTRVGGKVDTRSSAYHPALAPAGRELVAAVASDADDPREVAIYATYLATIEHATRRIWLTNAYFAPNRELRAALIDAARRGVDVRLIVPSFTDSGLILHASRASYDELLSGGVRIFEQHHALLHAKTAVIDTAVSMIGSANLDMRSFLHNNEVNAVIIGTQLAHELEAVFEQDLQDARELNLEDWRQRPALQKLKEFASSLFSYWL